MIRIGKEALKTETGEGEVEFETGIMVTRSVVLCMANEIIWIDFTIVESYRIGSPKFPRRVSWIK